MFSIFYNLFIKKKQFRLKKINIYILFTKLQIARLCKKLIIKIKT